MIEIEKLNLRITKLEEQLATKLRLRGKDLTRRLRRAGRLLPKHVRKAGAVIVQAQSRIAHPKLARLIDRPRLDRAFAILHGYLDGIDPAERRKDKMLGLLGGLVFSLMVMAGLVLAFLGWRGVL